MEKGRCFPRSQSNTGRIGARVDGNPQIGTGHMMRCLTLADEWRKQGFEAVFYTAEQISALIPQERNYICRVLGTDPKDMESELPILSKRLQADQIDLLLVDSYQVTVPYLQELSAQIKTVYIDDFGIEVWPVAGILNYNLYAPELGYAQRYSADTMVLSGSKFALVRPEFQKQEYSIRENVERVLVTVGGSDSLNIAGAIAAILRGAADLKDVDIDVVCGRYNSYFQGLKKMEKDVPNIRIHSNVSNMAELMRTADVAVSAAGTTMYELAAIGVPTVTFSYVDNQVIPAQAFAEKLGLTNAGNYIEGPDAVLTRIRNAVVELFESKKSRSLLSTRLRSCVDGQGAKRAVEALMRLTAWKK